MVRRVSVLGLALTLFMAACSGTDDRQGASGTGDLAPGGTLQLGLLSDVGAAFDPQKEYSDVAWQFFRCCLLRTLMSYPGVSGIKGSTIQPDLASGDPKVSNDGLTWTFKIKKGIHYAPPFQHTEITAGDFIRALEREADSEAASSGYSFYYNVIRGFSDFSHGNADLISGLKASDDNTLEVNLTAPTGDLGYRFAMAATAPIPPNAGKRLGAADGHTRDYGRFLVSSGPYMFEGSEDMDFGKPAAQQRPVSGYQPGRAITLIRNPTWVDEKDTDQLRPAYPDKIVVSIGGSEEDLSNKVDVGELDIIDDGVPPPQQVSKYQGDPDLSDQIFSDPSDVVRYFSFNLAEPPFDDIHVRRAVNYALDKEGMRRLRGGPLFGEIANHIMLDTLTENINADLNPYASQGEMGDLDAAKAEMSQSKYDSNGDGVCDDPTCDGILAVTDQADPFPDQVALIQDNLDGIGLKLEVKQFDAGAAYNKCLDPAAHTALCLQSAWGKDYPDARTFAAPLFGSESLGPNACCNLSLLGATPTFLKKYGYKVTDVPSADDRIAKCEPLQGEERTKCWADLDKYLMEDVVPWVPYLFDNNVVVVSSNLANYEFDQFSGRPALDHLALTRK